MWSFVSGFFHLAYFQGSYMLKHVPVLHSFLWPNNFPLYGCTTLCSSIHNWWSLGLFLLSGYGKWCYEHSWTGFCVDKLSLLLGLYLGVESLGHMVTLCLAFWATSELFLNCVFWPWNSSLLVWGGLYLLGWEKWVSGTLNIFFLLSVIHFMCRKNGTFIWKLLVIRLHHFKMWGNLKHGASAVARIGGVCLSSRVPDHSSSCISGHLSQSVTGTDKACLFQGHDYWATSVWEGLVGRPNAETWLLSGDSNKPGADNPANVKPHCVQSRNSRATAATKRPWPSTRPPSRFSYSLLGALPRSSARGLSLRGLAEAGGLLRMRSLCRPVPSAGALPSARSRTRNVSSARSRGLSRHAPPPRPAPPRLLPPPARRLAARRRRRRRRRRCRRRRCSVVWHRGEWRPNLW